MNHEIYSIQWEYEDQLPEISDLEYDLMYVYSQIRSGARMFPFITLYKSNEEPYRIYLGA